MNKVNQVLLVSVILLSILVIILVRMIILYRKQMKETVALMQKYKESINKDYEKDIQYLNYLIDEKMKFINTSLFPYISKDGKVITDSELNKLITSVTVDIKRNISESYKELVSYYISDLDLFIGSRLKTTLEPIFLTYNIKTLKQGTTIGDILDNYTESLKNQNKDNK